MKRSNPLGRIAAGLFFALAFGSGLAVAALPHEAAPNLRIVVELPSLLSPCACDSARACLKI